MKKTLKSILVFAGVLFSCTSFAQTNIFPPNGSVGIGTNTPDSSAKLEIKSTKQGLLIPRMTKAKRNAISNPATGLLIYQTNSTPGFYYYTGSEWQMLSSSSNSGYNWSLTGNSGTTSANFLGTTDLQPLNIKVNNLNSGIIDFNLGATAFGYGALKSNTTGASNTALGYNACYLNSTGQKNTAVGSNSMAANLTGSNNTAIGHYTMYGNATGSYNTAMGVSALSSNYDGTSNTAVGYLSMHANTSGYQNAALGQSSLYSNTTGGYNTGIGMEALYKNTTGYNNTATGQRALFSNTTGGSNSATGMNALYHNTTGYANTANGYQSLFTNTTGYENTANGWRVLYSNTTGNNNSANGVYALYSNIDGYYNVANGVSALFDNTSGSHNTANGVNALYSNTTGYENTGDGVGALSNNTIGNNNTALGYYANVSTGDLQNAMALGYNAVVNASSKVQVGNSGITVIGGQVGWSTFSDGRFKKNIKQNVPGLEFINKLNPVTYTIELKKFDQFLGKKDSIINSKESQEGYAVGEKKIHTGFIAQDVEKTAQQIGYDFDGINHPQNEKDNFSLVYADFVPSMVKAVQELSKENEELKDEIDELKEMVSSLVQGKTVSSAQSENAISLSSIILDQNIPNPLHNTTSIGYFIPSNMHNAQLMVTDMNGKNLKQLTLQNGKGTVTIDASTLSDGAYNYSLMVNGKIVASKKMVVAH